MSRQSAASTCRLEAASVGAQASRWGPGQVALEFGLGLGLGYGSATAFEGLVTSGQYASADTGLAALFQLFEDLGPEAFGLAA